VIAGSVWIYSNYDAVTFTPGVDTYCNPTLYKYAFWLMMVIKILMMLTMVLLLILCIVGCCAKHDSE